jgi:hypothetical protein
VPSGVRVSPSNSIGCTIVILATDYADYTDSIRASGVIRG